MYSLSTGTHTEWTWPSAHVPDTRLPDAYACQVFKGGLPPDRNCAVEPLLTAEYAVSGLAVDGSVHIGPQTVDLTIVRTQLAAAARLTGATVQFSTDDGASWQDASVADLGDGRYRATFTAVGDQGPRGAGYVALRVTATDSAGGRFVETAARAYRLAP
jgi:hypothetical protein